MGKTRGKSLADAVYAKKSLNKVNPFAVTKAVTAKHLNPFEVHINKEKFRILGRVCKHDKGLPGVSRSKASRKRKQTLGKEFMEKYKSNRFVDRRIGKNFNDSNINEDILNARFMADKFDEFKQSKHKKSRFNLNDDELLTHRGQTLEEIEHMRDERSDNDEESDQEKNLNAEFVEAAHFGVGGSDKSVKDHKQAIEEMIIEQKKRKMEIAKEKDAVYDLTEKLDSNYKDLISIMNNKRNTNKEAKEKPPPDDYDKLTRELIFEPRGVVTERLKTQQEYTQKSEERVKKLEEERIERMNHPSLTNNNEDYNENKKVEKPQQKVQHRSADELDQSYYMENAIIDKETLVYNVKGELSNTLSGVQNDSRNNEIEDVAQENHSSLKDDSNDEDESAHESDDESEDDVEDNLSDLKYSDSESNEDEEDLDDNSNIKRSIIPLSGTQKKGSTEICTSVPFLVDMPSDYTGFQNVLNNYKSSDQILLIERLFTCNQNDLKQNRKRDSNIQLFSFLLQLLNDKFINIEVSDVLEQFQFLSKLMPILYDLIHLDPKSMSIKLLDCIKEKYEHFCRKQKQYPSLEVLILFKLISNVYSTSDFRHPIATPCLIFMNHILSKSKITSRKDVAKGLFLVTLCLEYTTLSKRFVPAIFNFILGVISLTLPKTLVETISTVPQPFPKCGPASEILAIKSEEIQGNDLLENITEQKMLAEDLVSNEITLDFKVRCLGTCLKLAYDAITNIQDNIGSNLLAQPLLEMLSRIPLSNYPSQVCDDFRKLNTLIENWTSKPLHKLIAPAKKPKVLRLLEPRIEPVYDDKRRPKLSKTKEERVKLLHKVKRETKGAIREIRRDTVFLQKIRIQQQLQSDKERREKVKRIYAEAAMQQGELKALKRNKN